MKVELEVTFDRTEMSVVTLICGCALEQRKKNEKLGNLLRLEPVSL